MDVFSDACKITLIERDLSDLGNGLYHTHCRLSLASLLTRAESGYGKHTVSISRWIEKADGDRMHIRGHDVHVRILSSGDDR